MEHVGYDSPRLANSSLPGQFPGQVSDGSTVAWCAADRCFSAFNLGSVQVTPDSFHAAMHRRPPPNEGRGVALLPRDTSARAEVSRPITAFVGPDSLCTVGC